MEYISEKKNHNWSTKNKIKAPLDKPRLLQTSLQKYESISDSL